MGRISQSGTSRHQPSESLDSASFTRNRLGSIDRSRRQTAEWGLWGSFNESGSLIKRIHLQALLYGLAIILTLLAVVGVFNGLAIAIGDQPSRAALSGALIALTVCLVANALLLLAALAVQVLERERDAEQDARYDELWEPPSEGADELGESLGDERLR